MSVGAALAAVISELGDIFTSEKKQRAALKAFLAGKRCCHALWNDFSESLVKLGGASQLTSGRSHVANVTPQASRKAGAGAIRLSLH